MKISKILRPLKLAIILQLVMAVIVYAISLAAVLAKINTNFMFSDTAIFFIVMAVICYNFGKWKSSNSSLSLREDDVKTVSLLLASIQAFLPCLLSTEIKGKFVVAFLSGFTFLIVYFTSKYFLSKGLKSRYKEKNNTLQNKMASQSITEKNPSAVRAFIKAAFISFAIGVILQLSMLVIGAVNKELDEIWNKQEIPYDVKSEYIKLGALGGIQRKLSGLGLNSSSWVQQLLKRSAKTYYTKAINKIPQDDILVQLWFEYVYDIDPMIFNKANSLVSVQEMEKVLYFTKRLINAQSKVKAINHSYKYLMISNNLVFFGRNIFTLNHLKSQSKRNLKILFKEIHSSSKRNLKFCRNYHAGCTRSLNTIYHLLAVESVYIKEYKSKNKIYCHLFLHKTNIPGYLQSLRDGAKLHKNILNKKDMDFYNKEYELSKSFIEKKCKVNIEKAFKEEAKGERGSIQNSRKIYRK